MNQPKKENNSQELKIEYVGNFGNNKVYIEGTKEEALDLAYYIKRGIEAVKMLDDKDFKFLNKPNGNNKRKTKKTD